MDRALTIFFRIVLPALFSIGMIWSAHTAAPTSTILSAVAGGWFFHVLSENVNLLLKKKLFV